MKFRLVYNKNARVLNTKRLFLIFAFLALVLLPFGISGIGDTLTDDLTKITKDDVFKELVSNDAGKTEAVFKLQNVMNTEQINRNDIKINFNEVCGKVNSYNLLINSTCEAERVKEEIYDTRGVCYNQTINNTNVTKEKGNLDLKPIIKEICYNETFVKETIYENYTYPCFKEFEKIDATDLRNIKLDADVSFDTCSDGTFGHKVDWIAEVTLFDGITTKFLDKPEWAWWNSTWAYKQDINISNVAGNLTDYQVKLELNSSNVGANWNWSNDGNGTRYTNSSNNELDYWIEDWDSTTNTSTIWVEVPFLENATNTTISMYYGNSVATTGSNIESASLGSQGDDFEGTSGTAPDTDKWTVDKKGSVDAIVELDGSGNLHLAGEPNTISSGNAISKSAFLTNGFSIRARRKYSAENYPVISIGDGVLQGLDSGGQVKWWITSQGDGYAWWQISLTSRAISKSPSGSSKTNMGSSADSFGVLNTYEIIEFSYETNGTLKWMHDSIEKISGSDTTYLSSSKYLALTQGEYSDGRGGDSYYDWVFPRKYASPEPTILAIGAEESSNTAPTITANVTSPIIVYTNTDFKLNLTVTDPDIGDIITAYTQFYVNDTLIEWMDEETADSYYCNGTWDVNYPCTNAYDGDSETYANATLGQLYINYTKKGNIDSEWNKKDDTTTNVSAFNSGCYDYLNDTLMLMIEVKSGTSIGFYCYNGTTWYGLQGDIGHSSLYEEKMVWKAPGSREIANNTNTLVNSLLSSEFRNSDTLIAEFWAGDGTDNTSNYNTTEATVIGQLISACTDLTTSDITYYLDSDILNTGTTKCMEVSANDVTLDCQGHIIDATGTVEYGIYITNSGLDRENFKLVNCIVTDFTKGLYAVYSKGINITDSIIANNTQWDVHIDPSAVTTRCDSYFSNVTGTNGKPIVYYNTTVNITDWDNNASEIILCNADNSVIDNLVIDNGVFDNNGIQIYSENVTLKNSNISNAFGVWAWSMADYFTVEDSNFDDLSYAIYVYGSDYASIDNTTYKDCDYSVLYNIVSDSNVTNSDFEGSTIMGVYLYFNSDDNIVANCTFKDEAQSIAIHGASESNEIYGNTIEGATGEGGLYFWMNDVVAYDNKIFNNFFNNTVNIVYYQNIGKNYFNVTNQTGTRVYSAGTNIGGNFWATPTGTGYSENCTDSESDGFCDDYYNITVGNIDYLPLSLDYIYCYLDINMTIWDGSSWIAYGAGEYPRFRCTPTQTNCEPTNQDAGSSQSIFSICNNGTLVGTSVYMNMNTTYAGIALKCDDDYTTAEATTLTTANQTIHGALDIDACTDICCWADYDNPDSGGAFGIIGHVI